MAQLNFNIEDICGTLSENKDGWRKELTYISWNNRAPKFDLRSWDPDYQAMTKGITMTKEELEKLPHVKQVSLTKQGSWKLILDDESAGRELFPILTQGQYIATFDQQAPTIDEIFKLESGVEV